MHFLRGPQAFCFLVNAWIYSTLLYSFFSVLVAVVRIFFPNSPVFCCCCCCCRRFGCRVISMIQKNTDSDIIFFFSTFFFAPKNFFSRLLRRSSPAPEARCFFFLFILFFFNPRYPKTRRRHPKIEPYFIGFYRVFFYRVSLEYR